ACAVVEPAPGGQLRSVGGIPAKLAAFCREYEGGTLLVCPPGCDEVKPYRSRFDDHVWEVSSFSDLARFLEGEHLLEPLLREVPVSLPEWEFLHDQVAGLIGREHRYQMAIGLGQRLLACTPAGPMPAALRDEVGSLVAVAHRHLGQFVEAERAAQEVYAA